MSDTTLTTETYCLTWSLGLTTRQQQMKSDFIKRPVLFPSEVNIHVGKHKEKISKEGY